VPRAAELPRFLRTVRHLRPEQVLGRVRHHLWRPRPVLGESPPLRPLPGPWALPARREPSMTAPASFRFLSEERSLDASGWDDPALPKLWRYNLHYFDDLNAFDAALRHPWHEALQDRWIGQNPPAVGTGWEPYPTSLRAVNWIKAALGGRRPPARVVDSLAVQLRWLSRRLEFHLLGNHLFANAKALVFGGTFFAGDEADAWRTTGLRLLARELDEQVLDDGGQFERSPMYHALALEDVLDLVNLLQAAGHDAERLAPGWHARLRARVPAMRHWLSAMCHPDGEIAFFNDAAIGIAPAPAELGRYAAALGFEPGAGAPDGLVHLASSGYVCARFGPLCALLDVAPVGPDYLPGHAHADTLSFELSAAGQRVVVNGGTSCYGLGPQRLSERGTASHSTVQVAGVDSSEVWSGFRVGRRARPFDVRVSREAGGARVGASHDGYCHLPGRPVHRREWRIDRTALRVTDTVQGRTHEAVARFHLHPSVQPVRSGDAWRLGPLALRVIQGEASVVPSEWRPRFGERVPARCVQVELRHGRAECLFETGP
jgi:uncharacterized heparinase superfamily protein